MIDTVYRTSTADVRASFASEATARDYYRPYTDFLAGLSVPGRRLLDVGCGTGWSTYFLSAQWDATGVDLNPAAFEPTGCDLREGDALALPFPDESFDLVAANQCVEHVPDPRKALDEMCRVCRPGGVVAVVGPNLVSPVLALTCLRYARWRRRPGMGRHPYGNTVAETLAAFAARSWQLAAKLLRRTPQFLMREPDTTPPFAADNDASYLCCPTDLLTYFRARGWSIERRGKPGRPWPLYLAAGGTWVAARKPRR